MTSPPYSSGKNTLRVRLSRPSTPSFHLGSPLVCSCQTQARERQRNVHGTYVVVQVCSAYYVGGIVISPLIIPMVSAITAHCRCVCNVPSRLIKQWRCGAPIPYLLCPLSISIVEGIPSQSRGNLEKSAVGYGVLDFESRLIWINLPSKAPIARCLIPAGGLIIENSLSKAQPGRSVGDIRIFVFSGGKSGESPKSLVVVSL